MEKGLEPGIEIQRPSPNLHLHRSLELYSERMGVQEGEASSSEEPAQ